jgi:hypothetical protein
MDEASAATKAFLKEEPPTVVESIDLEGKVPKDPAAIPPDSPFRGSNRFTLVAMADPGLGRLDLTEQMPALEDPLPSLKDMASVSKNPSSYLVELKRESLNSTPSPICEKLDLRNGQALLEESIVAGLVN